MSEVKEKREKSRLYHLEWQKKKYKENPEFRAMKIRNVIEWRKKNVGKFREYQRNYQKKKRNKNV